MMGRISESAATRLGRLGEAQPAVRLAGTQAA